MSSGCVELFDTCLDGSGIQPLGKSRLVMGPMFYPVVARRCEVQRTPYELLSSISSRQSLIGTGGSRPGV